MKNLLDVKSFVIGFLLCLCVVLLMGFGGGSDSGRYIRFEDSNAVIDTKTGRIRPVYRGVPGVRKFLWNTPFEQFPPDHEAAKAM
jgi:hypothetical protein